MFSILPVKTLDSDVSEADGIIVSEETDESLFPKQTRMFSAVRSRFVPKLFNVGVEDHNTVQIHGKHRYSLNG